MSEEKEIVNKVAQSGLITIDLEDYYPKEEVVVIDLRDFLFEELVLKEKEFRQKIKDITWEDLASKIVTIQCSVDAIIPKWAYMLVSIHAGPFAKNICWGNEQEAKEQTLVRNISSNIKPEDYTDKRVIIKGCSNYDISEKVYIHISQMLQPHVKSLMYGEPCSTVPIYKKK